ncbi:MAG: hypothetical protein ACRDDF_05765, partial [Aeromonas sp.]
SKINSLPDCQGPEIPTVYMQIFISIIIYNDLKKDMGDRNVQVVEILKIVVTNEGIEKLKEMEADVQKVIKNEINEFSKNADYIKWKAHDIVGGLFKFPRVKNTLLTQIKGRFIYFIGKLKVDQHQGLSTSSLIQNFLFKIIKNSITGIVPDISCINRLTNFVTWLNTNIEDLSTYFLIPKKIISRILVKYLGSIFIASNESAIQKILSNVFKDTIEDPNYKGLFNLCAKKLDLIDLVRP